MSYYFKFIIPTNSDGTRISYSPNYHGTMNKCPKDVTVLLYNDEEGYGIAKTNDKFKPKEVKVIEEAVALGTLTDAALKDEEGVYFGEKLDNRWKPEPIVEEPKPEPLEEVYLGR